MAWQGWQPPRSAEPVRPLRTPTPPTSGFLVFLGLGKKHELNDRASWYSFWVDDVVYIKNPGGKDKQHKKKRGLVFSGVPPGVHQILVQRELWGGTWKCTPIRVRVDAGEYSLVRFDERQAGLGENYVEVEHLAILSEQDWQRLYGPGTIYENEFFVIDQSIRPWPSPR